MPRHNRTPLGALRIADLNQVNREVRGRTSREDNLQPSIYHEDLNALKYVRRVAKMQHRIEKSNIRLHKKTARKAARKARGHEFREERARQEADASARLKAKCDASLTELRDELNAENRSYRALLNGAARVTAKQTDDHNARVANLNAQITSEQSARDAHQNSERDARRMQNSARLAKEAALQEKADAEGRAQTAIGRRDVFKGIKRDSFAEGMLLKSSHIKYTFRNTHDSDDARPWNGRKAASSLHAIIAAATLDETTNYALNRGVISLHSRVNNLLFSYTAGGGATLHMGPVSDALIIIGAGLAVYVVDKIRYERKDVINHEPSAE